MKTTIQLLATPTCSALFSTSVQATLYYWDSDGTKSGGSQSTTADGTWGTSSFWSTRNQGDAATAAWTSSSANDAAFCAVD